MSLTLGFGALNADFNRFHANFLVQIRDSRFAVLQYDHITRQLRVWEWSVLSCR